MLSTPTHLPSDTFTVSIYDISIPFILFISVFSSQGKKKKLILILDINPSISDRTQIQGVKAQVQITIPGHLKNSSSILTAHHGHRIYSITQATKSQCSCAPSNIQIFSLFNELLQNTELLNAISLSSFTSAGMAMMDEFFMDNRRQAMKKGREKKKKSFFLLLKNF